MTDQINQDDINKALWTTCDTFRSTISADTSPGRIAKPMKKTEFADWRRVTVSHFPTATKILIWQSGAGVPA